MTTRERVLASRLIQKIDSNSNYAKQIGLSYKMPTAGSQKTNGNPNQTEEKKN